MAVQNGSRIGPYEIETALGAGGMGEVYRARDTRLNRHVAIKSLTAAFAQDPERVARFKREAQLLAALNHRTSLAFTVSKSQTGLSFSSSSSWTARRWPTAWQKGRFLWRRR
jgi:serine/threonine protein kinase